MYGIDIGATKVELAVFESNAELVLSERSRTPTESYSEFLNEIERMVVGADEKFDVRGSIGIGLPFAIDSQGRGISSNISAVNGRRVRDDIEERLGRSVAFGNDAKFFLFSEVNGGAAAGCRQALGVILGTGIAGAFCLDGLVYEGRQNTAGEFGHIAIGAPTLKRHGLPIRNCGCGKAACVDQYLSGPSLVWLSEFVGCKFDSVMELMDHFRGGDKNAARVFEIYADCLASYFADLTLCFDPDIIVLGGGLSNIPEIYPAVAEKTKEFMFDGVSPPPISAPKFGDSSGVRGAAISGYKLSNQGMDFET